MKITVNVCPECLNIDKTEEDDFKSGYSIYKPGFMTMDLPSFQIAFNNRCGISFIPYSKDADNTDNKRFHFNKGSVIAIYEDSDGNTFNVTTLVMKHINYIPSTTEVENEVFLEVEPDMLFKIIEAVQKYKSPID